VGVSPLADRLRVQVVEGRLHHAAVQQEAFDLLAAPRAALVRRLAVDEEAFALDGHFRLARGSLGCVRCNWERGEKCERERQGSSHGVRSFFSPKGWDNVAQGNALGWDARMILQAESLRQAVSQAFSLEDQCTANLGRCPRLCCPSPSG